MAGKYAITLVYENPELKHVYFDIQIKVKYPPKEIDDTTVEVTSYQKVNAMVDTGSTICAISKQLVKSMKLKPYGEKKFTYAKGSDESPYYVFDVVFPKGKLFEDIEAVEIDDSDCDFLIGMNILQQGDMAISWKNEKMVFSFRVPPADKYIDFYDELLKEQNQL